jgi:hypothetical protein
MCAEVDIKMRENCGNDSQTDALDFRIEEPPGRGTKPARCERERFFLKRKEKRQSFGDRIVG